MKTEYLGKLGFLCNIHTSTATGIFHRGRAGVRKDTEIAMVSLGKPQKNIFLVFRPIRPPSALELRGQFFVDFFSSFKKVLLPSGRATKKRTFLRLPLTLGFISR